MKEYEYKTITQSSEESDEQFLARVNELGKQGYRFLGESIYDSLSNSSRVVMERETTLIKRKWNSLTSPVA